MADNTRVSQPFDGIGTLSEKSVHTYLKRFYMPDPAMQEVPLGPFVADIFDGETVMEIQTGNFRMLKRKLDYYLPRYPVLVVYPLDRKKSIVWTDPETGESTLPRKSPHAFRPAEALHQLYQIREYLLHPGLTVHLVPVDLTEYRLLDGYGSDRKSRCSKADRIPSAVGEAVVLHSAEDYRVFLPSSLKEPFSASAFGRAAGLRSRQTYSAVHVLETVRVLTDDGRTGPHGAALYRIRES